MRKIVVFILLFFFIKIELVGSFKERALLPIPFSRDGINNFLTSIYNDNEYKDFLGFCYIHIIDLIEHAEKTSNCNLFLQKVFNIFIQKIYEIKCLNPYAFLYFLQQVHPRIISILFSQKIASEVEIKNVLKKSLEVDFSILRTDPDKFLDKCSREIFELSNELSVEYFNLQRIFSELVEISLSKIYFDILDEDADAFDCFSNISSTIAKLYDDNVVQSEEALNRMLWALSSQWNKSFLIQKNSISKEKADLLKKNFYFDMPAVFLIDETEKHIIKKSDYLRHELIKC